MAEKRTVYKMKDMGGIGEVHIADDVVAMIAVLAATDVEGVASMEGNITRDMVNRVGAKGLSKGVKVTIKDNQAAVSLDLNIKYGKNILETSKAVQDRVKTSVENMTGLEVTDVNVHIASVEMAKN